jgi:hypothetical protein
MKSYHTIGHDLKLLIENLSDHQHPSALSQKIPDGPIIEVKHSELYSEVS